MNQESKVNDTRSGGAIVARCHVSVSPESSESQRPHLMLWEASERGPGG